MRRGIFVLTMFVIVILAVGGAIAADSGILEIRLLDTISGKPVPARIHIKDAAGKPYRPANQPYWFDHFAFDGSARLEMPAGKYAYEIERGPEYERIKGSVEVVAAKTHSLPIRLRRLTKMTGEGYWPGELHVHRPVTEIELLMRAEDLNVAPVITWWNNRNLWAGRALPESPLKQFDSNRFTDVMAGEDEREGGALLFFHLKKPLAVANASREYPSPLQFVAEARKQPGVWIDIEKPFWWDMPTWVASGQVDSIGIANNHMCRDRMYENEAWGKPRLVDRLPAPRGNGYWSQEIYYHLLNTGVRLPPSAGSASGVLPNPVGYNRVYVHAGNEFSHERWWENLRKGQSFVTNGPLLRIQAGGFHPGHVFRKGQGEAVECEITGKLHSQDEIRNVEIIRDGVVDRQVPLEEFQRTGTLGKLRFEKSSWFLVRAIAIEPRTFRFASTAPFYVEIGDDKHRISKASAKFFLEWVEERMGRIKVSDARQKAEVMKCHERAREFWKEKVAKANAP